MFNINLCFFSEKDRFGSLGASVILCLLISFILLILPSVYLRRGKFEDLFGVIFYRDCLFMARRP